VPGRALGGGRFEEQADVVEVVQDGPVEQGGDQVTGIRSAYDEALGLAAGERLDTC
jgi:hypothetical protein